MPQTKPSRRAEERQRVRDADFRMAHPWCVRCQEAGRSTATVIVRAATADRPREALCRRHGAERS